MTWTLHVISKISAGEGTSYFRSRAGYKSRQESAEDADAQPSETDGKKGSETQGVLISADVSIHGCESYHHGVQHHRHGICVFAHKASITNGSQS